MSAVIPIENLMDRESVKQRLLREAIEIFDEMPGKRGVAEQKLVGYETEFQCTLPPIYRRLMAEDGAHLSSIPGVSHPDKLRENRQEADYILCEETDDYTYRLQIDHVVFAWENIYGFYFFEGNGSDETPVYIFNYYDDTDGGLPRIVSPSIGEFLAEKIREYLQLPIR